MPAGDRFSAWREIVSKTHLPLAMELTSGWSPEDFSAEVREQRLGELSLLDTFAVPHRGWRTQRQAVAHSRDVVGLQFIAAGREAIEIGDETVMVETGDVMFWDGGVAGGYEILEPLRKRTLIMPRSVAATALPGYRNSFVRSLPGDLPSARTLASALALLSDRLGSMSDGARQAAAEFVVQLVTSLDTPQDDANPANVGWSRWELRERALRYIDDHLGDRQLGPVGIATANSVSVRTLYAAVDGLGVTLATYIRNRRLARCYDDLVHRSDPVATVALRWGFSGPAHFSRVFRQRYGVAPTAVRRHRRQA
jgi:AraC family transcriptional activator of tynA and feaB